MKILMLGDCSCVGFELARELRTRRHSVEHVTFNHNSLTRYVQGFYMLFKARFSECDLIHVHYLRFLAYIALLSGKPFILHCHGSDLRNNRLNWLKRRCLRKARKVLVSTPDLLEFVSDAVWLPTPVGFQFHDYGLPRAGAVYFQHGLDGNGPLVDLSYVRLDRNVPYERLPETLNKFKCLVHCHFMVFSKLGLEALACGCSLKLWDKRVVQRFPLVHWVDRVVDRLLPIYMEALND